MSNLGRRVWILEDDSDLRSLMGFMVSARGCEVHEAGSLKEAWKLLDQAEVEPARFSPDFVMSDHLLPEGDSEAWMTALRTRFPNSPVLCITGSLDADLEGRLATLGIGVAEKPIRLSTLLELMARMDFRT